MKRNWGGGTPPPRTKKKLKKKSKMSPPPLDFFSKGGGMSWPWSRRLTNANQGGKKSFAGVQNCKETNSKGKQEAEEIERMLTQQWARQLWDIHSHEWCLFREKHLDLLEDAHKQPFLQWFSPMKTYITKIVCSKKYAWCRWYSVPVRLPRTVYLLSFVNCGYLEWITIHTLKTVWWILLSQSEYDGEIWLVSSDRPKGSAICWANSTSWTT